MAVTIKLKTGNATDWTTPNPTLLAGEVGFELDTYKFKIGDGTTPWNSRAYFVSAVAAHFHNASDINAGTLADARVAQSNVTQHQAALVLSAAQLTSGTLPIARIADDDISNAKLANMVEARFKGRASGAGTGDPTDLTAAQAKAILAYLATEVSYDSTASGLGSSTVQAAIDALDAAVDALISGAPEITSLNLAGASTANFPSGASKGDQFIIANAHANGTTLGSTNQEVVNTDDILLALVDGASTTNGADWHVKDNTDKVVSVAGRTGPVVLAAADIASGTMADARIAQSNVTQHQAALSIATSQLTGTLAAARFAVNTINLDVLANTTGPIVIGRQTASAGANSALSMATLRSMLQGAAFIGTTEITDGTVTSAKLANMVQATVKGRASGAGTGVPVDLTAAQLVAIITGADGAGTGLDADLFEGQHGSFYQNASNLNAGTIPSARVAAGAVTQHQGALAIAGSQLTGTIDGGTP